MDWKKIDDGLTVMESKMDENGGNGKDEETNA